MKLNEIKNLQEAAKTVLPPKNKEWGLYGTVIGRFSGARSDEIWNEMFMILLNEFGGEPIDIRNWLDSRMGRHFGDEVINKQGDAKAAWESIKTWKGLKKDYAKVSKERDFFESKKTISCEDAEDYLEKNKNKTITKQWYDSDEELGDAFAALDKNFEFPDWEGKKVWQFLADKSKKC